MTHALVPGSPAVDVFEDQVFSIFGAIRDAGFVGQISGPEWTRLDNGKEAALIIIDHVNTTTNAPWNVQFSLIREPDDDTVTLYVRPFVGGEWRPISQNLSHFQLYHAIEHETLRAMNTHSPPLRLYLDITSGVEPIAENVAIFPIEKTFLETPSK